MSQSPPSEHFLAYRTYPLNSNCPFSLFHSPWQSPGFPCGSAGKESACNVGDLGLIPVFDPCVGKIPWRRERLPTPVFWPGEFHGLYSPWGRQELGTTEWLSLGNNHSTFCLYNLTGLGTSNKWNHTHLSFCDWLISLSIMFSVFIHATAFVRINLLFKAKWYYMSIPHFVYPFIC